MLYNFQIQQKVVIPLFLVQLNSISIGTKKTNVDSLNYTTAEIIPLWYNFGKYRFFMESTLVFLVPIDIELSCTYQNLLVNSAFQALSNGVPIESKKKLIFCCCLVLRFFSICPIIDSLRPTTKLLRALFIRHKTQSKSNDI